MRAPGPRLLSLVAVTVTALALALAAPASAEELVGLVDGTQLVRFDSATPGNPGSPVPITGLQAGEQIVGIDFRPATGQLYGVGNLNRLYTIDPATGAATPVGPPGFTLSGNDFGVDFNPVSDRLRVVSDADQNLLIDPGTGAQVASGPNLGPGDPSVTGSAYTNAAAGGPAPTLYGIDFLADVLVTQDDTSGQLIPVGPLGVNPDAPIGFDIAPSGTAYFVAGFLGGSFFHTLNLNTGQATDAGTIPIPFIDGLTAVRVPQTYVVPTGPEPGGQTFTFPGCPPETAARTPVVLTDGNDLLRGTPLGDLIFGAAGNDLISGAGGDDCLDLGAGADLGRGGSGADRVGGGPGVDLVTGNTGNDALFGALPPNRQLRGARAGARPSQAGGDRISGGRGNDLVVGSSAGDRLFGRRGRDRLRGGRGRDRLVGGAGADRIVGGPGNDRILARGGGRDRILCGGGNDRVEAGAGDRLAASCE